MNPMFNWLDLLPKWIQNFFPAQPTIQVEHDVARPIPKTRIDFLGRIPVTRPSSPSEDSECNSDCDSECEFKIARISQTGKEESKLQPLLMLLPTEIRQQIWKDVLGGFTIHLHLEHRRLRGWVCCAPDPKNCNNVKAFHCAPGGRLDIERKEIISLLLVCRLM
jgi:hypothetical protein